MAIVFGIFVHRWACGLLLLLAMTANVNAFRFRSHEPVDVLRRINDIAINEQLLTAEFKSYIESGNRSAEFQSILHELYIPIDALRSEIDDLPTAQSSILCVICRSAFRTFMDYRLEGKDDDFIKENAFELCTNLNLYPANICQAVIDLNTPILLHIIDRRPEVTPEIACSVVMQGSDCTIDDPYLDWSITVDQSVGAITGSKDNAIARGPDDLTIVQISDPHYDPNYVAGNNAACDEPACCRRLQGAAESAEEAAGKWGDYRDCDTPWIAVEDAFKHIRAQHKKIDLVYFTGDIVDHGVWETTQAGNEESIKKVYQLLRDTFRGVPVYPILGNHEPHPVNQVAPNAADSTLNTEWLYNLANKEWSSWLPSATSATIRRGGYYSTLARPGLRVIGLNNNDCYTYNWWLLYAPSFPAVQLQWLHDQLLAAEANHERVHILAHVPSGEGSCFVTWSREYRRIIDRFHMTISGVFNGHSHKDEFNIFYAQSQPSAAINVGWNGGSVTAYSFVNPNYRVYNVDPTEYQVNHHETWIYNLTAANLEATQPPSWYKEYVFAEEFGVANLSPASLDRLVEQFAGDLNKFRRYWELKVKMGDPSLEKGCDDLCLAEHLCEIVITQFGDNQRCFELTASLRNGIP